MAFGAVLEGPDPVNLRPIVEQAMPMLIELMHDPSVVVKDTAAWTIGRVCELHTEAAINEVISPRTTVPDYTYIFQKLMREAVKTVE